MSHRFYMVDVFSEAKYSGNPLAVVVGENNLSEETMQHVATEINFSETTFVNSIPEVNGGYNTRIFTPAKEIAFAGHPILGTAHIIRQHVVTEPCTKVQLNLTLVQIPITFQNCENGNEIAWFLAPPMSLGPTFSPEPIAAALGLLPKDIETIAPIQSITSGVTAMIVPLNSLDALQRCNLTLESYSSLAAQNCPSLIYLFCKETYNPTSNDLCARFFFEANGVREDPATGNGAAFLGAYLLEHQIFPRSKLSFRIEQGHEINRPSLVMLRAQMLEGVRNINVGGNIIPTVQGELL